MDDLKKYIQSLLDQKRNPQEIKANLISAGWNGADVDRVIEELFLKQQPQSQFTPPIFAGQTETALQTANPSLPPTLFEIFLGLGALSLLWTSAFALGTLFYQLINKQFPDAAVDTSYLSYFYPSSSGLLHYSIATLIVYFPLYVLLMWLIFRYQKNNPSRIESRLVKWLTYIVLFVAAGTAIGDLSSLVYNFLEGELGARTVLKIITTFAISALVFVLYFFERKKNEYKREVPAKIFWAVSVLATLFVILGIILGFVLGGSPGNERKKKFDSQRGSDLTAITSAITSSSYADGLPKNLEELKAGYQYGVLSITDPETKLPYEYRVVSEDKLLRKSSYELCATFDLSNLAEVNQRAGFGLYGGAWAVHDAGRVCKQKSVSIAIDNTPNTGSQNNSPLPLNGPYWPNSGVTSSNSYLQKQLTTTSNTF